MADEIPVPSKWPLWETAMRYINQDPVQVEASTRETYMEKAHSSEVYLMKKGIRGRCLLLMNARFPKKLIHDSGQMEDRYYNKRMGTYQELQHMRQLFQQLGFIVVSRINKTAVEMNECLEMERHHSYHEVAECFVCVISTYGTQRHLFGADGGKMTYRSILQKFDDFRCPALKGKPKLFFINSSSGVQYLYNDRSAYVTEDEAQRYLGFVPWIELPPDMFLLLPNIPGFRIWNFIHGGVLFETVVYIFERWAHAHDLQTLIDAVTRLTRKFKAGPWFGIGRHSFQITTYFSTMKRKLYFFPGQSDTEITELHPSVPEEIRHMPPDAVDLYLKILETGVERRNNIRLMMVGLYATGKTSLARRLMGQSIEDVESTDGIEIHKGRCTISLEDGVWSTEMPSETEVDPSSRLAALVRENSKDGYSPERRAPEGQSNTMNDEVVPPSPLLPDRNLLDTILEYLDIYRIQLAVVTVLIACLVMSIFMHQSTGLKIILHLGMALVAVLGGFAWALILLNRLESELERNINEYSESAITKDEFGCIQSVSEKDSEQLKNMRRIMEKTSSKSPTTGKKVSVSIWDFAGQFVYYSTHQLFLSPRAIYIVTMKLTNDLVDCITDDIWFMDANGKRELHVHAGYRFWLRSLHSYIGGSSAHRNVILVGTHKDKIQGSEEDKAKQIQHHFEGISQLLQGNAVAEIINEKTFAVSNLEEDPNIPELRKTILDIAKSQPYWNEELPAKWIQLEDRLIEEREKGKIIITFDDVVNIDRTCPAPIYDLRQLKLFLTYENSIGNLAYYDQQPIQDTVILDPQWIVNAFSSLVADVRSSKKFGEIDDEWVKMTKTAIITDCLAMRIWKANKDDLYIKYQKELLRYMEKMSMIAKARIVSDDGQEEEELPIYFIPCLLKTSPDESFVSCLRTKDSTCSPVLCFAFEKNFLPPSVFHRLLASCIAKWPVSRQGRKFLMFCGCGIFDISTGASRHRLTILHLGDVIAIRISLVSSTMKYLDGRLCDQARRFVDSTLNKEFRRFLSLTGRKDTMSNKSKCETEEEERIPPFKCRILCPDIQDIRLASENEGLIDVEELLVAHEEGLYSCVEHSDRHDPHIIGTRDVLKDWYPDKVGSGCSSFETMCGRLEDLKEQIYDKPLSDLHMSRIARCIGRGWEGLGIELGLSSTEIEHVVEDFPQNMCNRIHQVLKIWEQKTGREATFGKLICAIKNSGCTVNEEQLKNVLEGNV